ncbi:hypothetical protein D9758_015595 [Tetrapyrgos nigripes]|uniref:Uncharacterized protein n=1 Tax=Tetrapyrgos nigripes TaxID=182062 RepID=A0A8H5FK15_9AGAR|nr:hypothetical protein D9758_015595 [Tetrapyrgos nigripes]
MLRVGTPALCLSTSLTPLAIAHLINTVKPSTILISARTSQAAKKALDILVSQYSYSPSKLPKLLLALSFEELIPGPKSRQGFILQSLSQKAPPPYKAWQRDDVDAYIMHSSGTTGLPKPIYHSQVYPLIYATSHRFPEPDPAKFGEDGAPFGVHLSTPPVYHALGLLAPSMALSIGMPFFLLPSTVIPTARTVLSAIKSTNAKYMLSVPSILEDILALSHSNGGNGAIGGKDEVIDTLRQLEVLAIGGAGVKQATSDELVRKGVKFLVQGGTTEVGPIAPIEPVPPGYDHRYLILRNDIGLELVPVEGGGPLARQLIGHPPGWKKPFVMQDLIELNPSPCGIPDYTKGKQKENAKGKEKEKPNWQIRILGRIDDLIVLATGKKDTARQSRKGAMGLIIELRSSSTRTSDMDTAEISKSLTPYLEQGNSLIDDQGKVFKEMIIFTSENVKPLIRTDKGSLARRASVEVFKEEIDRCYDLLESSGGSAGPSADVKATKFPSPSEPNFETSLRNKIRSLVYDVTDVRPDSSSSPTSPTATLTDFDTTDFFETGLLNSLQAKRLHAYLLGGLRATPIPNLPMGDNWKLDQDFVFQYPSVEKLTMAVGGSIGTSTMFGSSLSGKDEVRIKVMEAMVEKYCGHLKSFAGIAKEANDRRMRMGSGVFGFNITTPRQLEGGAIILLTGSTGSLGCMILASLAKNPRVEKIICLNRLVRRPGNRMSILQRQREAMKKRGAVVSGEDWNKIILLESELHSPNFGLDKGAFEALHQVTHIIHNAWPVDFNMKLASFESQIKLLTNLILLGMESTSHRQRAIHSGSSTPTRVILLSSIAVVGRYSILNQEQDTSEYFGIPEEFFGAEYSTEMGYAESKWVAERLMLVAGEMYGRGEEALVQTSSIRMGQLTGAEGSGAWNESEHFPLIVRTSTFMKKLPSLPGSSSWLPVNRAADIIAELLFSQGFKPLYQLENPSRQSWSGILRNLSIILGGSLSSPIPIIPYDDWLDEVRKLGDDPRNKVLPIFDYLEKHFMRISSGETILRTSNATQDSSSMVRSTSLDLEHLEEYVNYWSGIDSAPTRRARPRL